KEARPALIACALAPAACATAAAAHASKTPAIPAGSIPSALAKTCGGLPTTISELITPTPPSCGIPALQLVTNPLGRILIAESTTSGSSLPTTATLPNSALALSRAEDSKLSCQTMWSSARFNTVPTSGRKVLDQ